VCFKNGEMLWAEICIHMAYQMTISGQRAEPTPQAEDAVLLVHAALGVDVLHVARFPTGLAHYVYDVTLSDGQQVVARIARRNASATLVGARAWSALLRPLGVPLPAILVDDVAAQHTPFPALLLERLPGSDLGLVYPSLDRADKQRIAQEVAHIQGIVHTLPPAKGYGFVALPDVVPPHPTWSALLGSELDRSAARLIKGGLFGEEHVERVRDAVRHHEQMLAAIPSVAFLDDTTTKNVLVYAGQLSGIVDVDLLCYGDPLFTVALTRTSLLSRGYDTDYIDAWCAAIGMASEQQPLLDLYTAVFCVNFLSEEGHAFNQDAARPVDYQRVTRLEALLSSLIW
jgi:aminoglycoside phosphotransferase (APT) family kinase protein